MNEKVLNTVSTGSTSPSSATNQAVSMNRSSIIRSSTNQASSITSVSNIPLGPSKSNLPFRLKTPISKGNGASVKTSLQYSAATHDTNDDGDTKPETITLHSSSNKQNESVSASNSNSCIPPVSQPPTLLTTLSIPSKIAASVTTDKIQGSIERLAEKWEAKRRSLVALTNGSHSTDGIRDGS